MVKCKLYAVQVEFFTLIALCYAIIALQKYLHFSRILVIREKIFTFQNKLELFSIETVLNKIKHFGCLYFGLSSHRVEDRKHMISMLFNVSQYLFHAV